MAGCASDSNTASESSGDEVSLLFVQDADGATLDGGTLTMIEVSPSTGWFSDRPVREAAQMATADFVSLWAEGGTFAVDPPNADFACQVDGATVNVVVELSSPVVNGRTLTYDTVRVGDTPDGNYDCDSNAHLFVDAAGSNCAAGPRGSSGRAMSAAPQCCARAKGSTKDLAGANLAGCELIRANLANANLTGADMAGVALEDANLTGADLTDVNLSCMVTDGSARSEADMLCADLTGADLTGVNLTGADLINADLDSAKLIGANLTDANLDCAAVAGVNMMAANLDGTNLNCVTGWNGVKSKDMIRNLDKAKNVPD